MTKNNGIEKFIRADLASFGGYSAHTSPDTLAGKVDVPLESIIKIDANENPYGCSPRVGKALAAFKGFNIYPDDDQGRLRQMLASYCGANAQNIVATAGSNQLIDLISRLMLNPGDEIINCVPTFGIFRFSALLCGGKVVEVPRGEDFNFSAQAVKAAITDRTKLIFLVNPNNPTGTMTPQTEVEAVLETGLPVMVDEAYYEFSQQTVLPLMSKYPNLMILRTFSKWAGLAGIRVGYGIFPQGIAEYLLRIKMPYNVSMAAQVAVEESLKDLEYLQGNVNAVIQERSRLFKMLQDTGWLEPAPTQANFIICRVQRGEAKGLKMKLQRKGILVRHFDDGILKNYIRFSVGKPEHTDALAKALNEISKEH